MSEPGPQRYNDIGIRIAGKNTQRDRLRDPTALWCKWFGPADQLAALGPFELRLALRQAMTGDRLLVANAHVWHESEMQRDMYLVLDKKGDEVRRWTSDGYKSAVLAGELPDADLFGMLDITELPPVAPDTGQ